MAKQTNLSDVPGIAKKVWAQAGQTVEPLTESALDLAIQSVKNAKRVAKNTRRFARKNPWTTAGIIALVAAASIATIVQLKRRQKPYEDLAGV